MPLFLRGAFPIIIYVKLGVRRRVLFKFSHIFVLIDGDVEECITKKVRLFSANLSLTRNQNLLIIGWLTFQGEIFLSTLIEKLK